MDAPTTTSDRIYSELRQMVFTGELAPGERLVQRKLAGQLGVSSIPIIEATRRLQQDGLVISHPNWGAHVRQWSEEDIEGAYLAREALEGISCRLFVERADDEQRARLLSLAQKFKEQVANKDAQGWLQADMDLHQHIVRSTKSHALAHITDSSFLISTTMSNSHKRPGGGPPIVPTMTVHDELVDALLQADAAAAERVGREHIRSAYERMRELQQSESNTDL